MSKLSLSALVAACMVSVTFAQQTQAPKRSEAAPAQPGKAAAAPREPGQQDQDRESNVNRQLGSCVAIKNQEEIALSRFALEHAQNAEVKKFAQMLIDEHTKFGSKLAQYATEAANRRFDDVDTKERANREATQGERKTIQQTAATDDGRPVPKNDPKREDITTPPGRQTVTAAHSGQWNQDRMVSIERQVAQECLSLAKKELTDAKDSNDFDKAFLGCQIAAHLGMIAKLTVFEGETDSGLSQVLSEGRTATEKHLAEAKRLMDELKDK